MVLHDRGRRLIFCINPGRAGSQYLAGILGTARQVRAYHEPRPKMAGPVLHTAMYEPLAGTRAERMVKAQWIRLRTAWWPRSWIYAETNHMFIKTFHDVVVRAFAPEQLDVIVLRRYLPAIVRSFVRMGYFSDRNDVWPGWMYDADVPNALVPPVAPVQDLDAVDRAVAYLIDIEARAQRFLSGNREIRCHEVRLEELQDFDAVAELFERLSIGSTDATARAVGRRVNERSRRKAEMDVVLSIESCERRIADYLALCESRGIEIPRLPHLTPS